MAKKKTSDTLCRLERIEGRLIRLEKLQMIHSEQRNESRETPIEAWQFLVRRQHRWRMQLYIKGRNLTARQLVGSINANQLDEQKAAANFHLPIEAIREAIAYVAKNRELLEAEAEIERLMRKREGVGCVPQPVS